MFRQVKLYLGPDIYNKFALTFIAGNFDVGPGGAPNLLNCVAYKLCYYKFGQMETEYHKPPGYDRARGKEVKAR